MVLSTVVAVDAHEDGPRVAGTLEALVFQGAQAPVLTGGPVVRRVKTPLLGCAQVLGAGIVVVALGSDAVAHPRKTLVIHGTEVLVITGPLVQVRVMTLFFLDVAEVLGAGVAVVAIQGLQTVASLAMEGFTKPRWLSNGDTGSSIEILSGLALALTVTGRYLAHVHKGRIIFTGRVLGEGFEYALARLVAAGRHACLGREVVAVFVDETLGRVGV